MAWLATVPLAALACVDADGDGYRAKDDCDDHDVEVNAAALEICYDGVDNDCDGVAASCRLSGTYDPEELQTSAVDLGGEFRDLLFLRPFGSAHLAMGATVEEGPPQEVFAVPTGPGGRGAPVRVAATSMVGAVATADGLVVLNGGLEYYEPATLDTVLRAWPMAGVADDLARLDDGVVIGSGDNHAVYLLDSVHGDAAPERFVAVEDDPWYGAFGYSAAGVDRDADGVSELAAPWFPLGGPAEILLFAHPRSGASRTPADADVRLATPYPSLQVEPIRPGDGTEDIVAWHDSGEWRGHPWAVSAVDDLGVQWTISGVDHFEVVDLDRDGADDMVLSRLSRDGGVLLFSRISVFYGPIAPGHYAPGDADAELWIDSGEQTALVSALHDVDGDGLPELALGWGHNSLWRRHDVDILIVYSDAW